MTKDRAEYKLRLWSVLCSAALLATFLATRLKAADCSKYLFGRSLVQSSSLAWFFVFELFVRELPLPSQPARETNATGNGPYRVLKRQGRFEVHDGREVLSQHESFLDAEEASYGVGTQEPQ
jgi:hypothetical protein